MATKATHFGACQVCGHRQLLPGGRLSIHGYNVRWSQFVGTCPGSRHLPFEQDISLIENAIARAEAEAARLTALAATWREPVAEGVATAWIHEYVPAQGYGRVAIRSHYRWVERSLTAVEHTSSDRTWTWLDFSYEKPGENGGPAKSKRLDFYSDRPKTMADAVLQLNSKFAESLDSSAAKHLEYAAWQTSRIKGWAPSPLTPRPVAV